MLGICLEFLPHDFHECSKMCNPHFITLTIQLFMEGRFGGSFKEIQGEMEALVSVVTPLYSACIAQVLSIQYAVVIVQVGRLGAH